jgi:hypothetical protein
MEIPQGRLPKLALVMLFAAFAVIAFGYAIHLGSPKGDPIDAPQPTFPPATEYPISLESGAPVALARARQWREDASLVLMSEQVDWIDGTPAANGLPRGGALIYTFASPDHTTLGRKTWQMLTVMLSRSSGTIYHEETSAWQVDPGPAIDLSRYPVSSNVAFDLAQGIVGARYRDACAPLRSQAQIVLDTTDPEKPAWTVVYYDQRSSGTNDIVVRISARTGQTTTALTGTPQACPQPTS